MANRNNERYQLTLHKEMDAEIIQWLASIPSGRRADTVREAIRAYMYSTVVTPTTQNAESVPWTYIDMYNCE